MNVHGLNVGPLDSMTIGKWRRAISAKARADLTENMDTLWLCWEYGVPVEHTTPDPKHRIAIGADGKKRTSGNLE